VRTKLINLQKGGRALKFKVEYILPLDEIVCRVCREINLFGTKIPLTREEALTICMKQIQTGIGINWDSERENDILGLRDRLLYLFPELE
jgi:hypothetical protein